MSTVLPGERGDGKIQGWHRDRLAVIYVRQSSRQQVADHGESTRLQYGLTERAGALGWPASRVMVIDEDLGRSAANAAERPGFARLVAEITMGHVGLVLGLEMSRLARAGRDWHQLTGAMLAGRAGPGRAEPGVRGAGRGQPLPPLLFCIGRQAPLQGAVERRRRLGLIKDPQAIELAGRLDDPGRHQVPEHLVPARRVIEPENPVCLLEGIHQVAHLRGGDRQRPAARRLQAQVELGLPGRDPLLRRCLQGLQRRVIVRRPEMLDLPRSAPRGPHDLHRGRTQRGLHGPHIRHQATLKAAPNRMRSAHYPPQPDVYSRHQ